MSAGRGGPAVLGLRPRLNLLLSVIFLLTVLIAVVYLLHNARRAVVDEITASTELASTLIRGLEQLTPANVSESKLKQWLDQLTADGLLRHVSFRIVSEADEGANANNETADSSAPDWFYSLVKPDALATTRYVTIGESTIRIAAEPQTEIDEAWRETRVTLLLIVVVFVGANLVVFVTLSRALKPLFDLSRALEGVEHGQFAARLKRSGIADIDRLTERFNLMAAALENSEHDNALLTQRSLAIQEDERRRLAHELHDEMGQSITAIKALAVSIRERADDVLAARAVTIIDASSAVYDRVRQMMTRLHPVIVDELGVVSALEKMIDDWNSHHDDCFCKFRAEGDFSQLPAEHRIALYRIVQEALTNVARHAAADEVSVKLNLRAGGEINMRITDNGRGMDLRSVRRGLGMLGMRERARAIHGELLISSEPGQGTSIDLKVPINQNGETTATSQAEHA